MRPISFFIALVFCLTLTACGGGSGGQSNSGNGQPVALLKLFLAGGGVVNGTTIDEHNNTITVQAGTSLTGTVNLTSHNLRDAGDVVPVIYQPSWGARSGSFVTVNNWVGTGVQSVSANLNLTAPLTTGTYLIYFASEAEHNGSQVASSTNWQVNGGTPVWNDGNDIVDLSLSQISNSLTDGYVVVSNFMTPSGASPVAVGMTFLQINVTP